MRSERVSAILAVRPFRFCVQPSEGGGGEGARGRGARGSEGRRYDKKRRTKYHLNVTEGKGDPGIVLFFCEIVGNSSPCCGNS